ncbi:nodulation efficiency protein D (NfeD) family protein [Pseudomonas aeruginosa]|nr:nodulation efficiency protein D (NfeD) family protein [Pseudomonas aeruginosa]
MEILLLRLDFWDWLAFGTVLLLLEIFGAGGYLLRVGLTAACVGALGALLPGLAWPWQVGLFVLLSGLVAALHRTPSPQAGSFEETPGLQRRGDDLFGRTFPLHRAIVGGLGELRVEDASWLVSGPDLPRGALVRVTGQDGALLHVEPGRALNRCSSRPAGAVRQRKKATGRSSPLELRDGKRDLM